MGARRPRAPLLRSLLLLVGVAVAGALLCRDGGASAARRRSVLRPAAHPRNGGGEGGGEGGERQLQKLLKSGDFDGVVRAYGELGGASVRCHTMALQALTKGRGARAALDLWATIEGSTEWDPFLCTAVLSAQLLARDVRGARSLFKSLTGDRKLSPDAHLLTTYARVLALESDAAALSLIDDMAAGRHGRAGAPTAHTWTAAMKIHLDADRPSGALDVFYERLHRARGAPNLHAFATAVKAHGLLGDAKAAEKLFRQALDRDPDRAASSAPLLTAVVRAVASSAGDASAFELLDGLAALSPAPPRASEAIGRAYDALLTLQADRVRACAGDASQALSAVRETALRRAALGAPPRAHTYNAVASALLAGGAAREAAAVFSEGLEGFPAAGGDSPAWCGGMGCAPNTFSASIAMHALMAEGSGAGAVEVFRSLYGLGLAPDAALQCALLEALAGDGAGDEARRLVASMRADAPRRERSNAVIKALVSWREHREAVEALAQDLRRGCFPRLGREEIAGGVMDCHGMAEDTARTLVRAVLMDALAPEGQRLLAGPALFTGDLHFVVGRGGSRRDAREGVLREAVIGALRDFPGGGLEGEALEGNEGRVLLRKETLDAWLQAQRRRRLALLSTVMPDSGLGQALREHAARGGVAEIVLQRRLRAQRRRRRGP